MCIAVIPLLLSTLDDPTLTNTHHKQMYEERKRELLVQQRQGEQEHLQILKTIAEQDAVDFRLKTLQERQKVEKQLLQEVMINFKIWEYT